MNGRKVMISNIEQARGYCCSSPVVAALATFAYVPRFYLQFEATESRALCFRRDCAIDRRKQRDLPERPPSGDDTSDQA